jgi:carbon-monoxide dehydrogenase small subunit
MTARTISFTLNGEPVSAEIATHHTILEVLRNEFALYGARESCGQGLCGCCTVLVNGTAVSGCLYLAAFADGAEVTTVESLDASGTLDPIQEAFIEEGAFQCGFCTPGFINEQAVARPPSRSGRRSDQALSGRQSVPLRRLSGDHQGGEVGGEEAGGGAELRRAFPSHSGSQQAGDAHAPTRTRKPGRRGTT